LVLAVLLGVVGYHVLHWRIPGSSEALLEQADEKSWVNNWIAAEPLYRQAELGFIRKHEPSKALYAHVSEIPAESESSISVPAQLAELTADPPIAGVLRCVIFRAPRPSPSAAQLRVPGPQLPSIIRSSTILILGPDQPR
jgi:hypothetical protein